MTTLAFQFAWPTLDVWIHRPRAGVESIQTWFNLPDGISPDYVVSLPTNYNPTDKFPLLLVLHGSGECGADIDEVVRSDLQRLILKSAEDSIVIVSPQCPKGTNWDAGPLLQLFDELVERYSVDEDRIYVLGYSMGAFGAWELGATAPDRIAAIIPIAGGGPRDFAENLKRVAIWAIHGEQDGVVPTALTKALMEEIRAAGGSPRMTLFPEIGHDLPKLLYDPEAVVAWVLKQRLRK